ncbi:MAG: ATP-binding protein [Candidatus Omnitrophota bacterium]
MIISETLVSNLEALSKFIPLFLDKIKFLLIEKDEIFDIRLCLEEALINAIKHGNKMDPGLFVKVNVDVKGGSLIIEVKDQGEGFDFEKLLNPTQEENIKRTSGRGIFLIKRLMDKVEFFDGGRGIKMLKHFEKGGSREYKTRKI